MPVSYNPSIVVDGLVLCLDAANRRSYPGSGVKVNNLTPAFIQLSNIGSGDTFNYVSEFNAATLGLTDGPSDVKGERDSLSPCSGLLTFDEAVAFAHKVGARLPTRQEILDGVGTGTGCGYDAEQVWTCDKSDANGNSHYTMFGNTGAYGTTETSQANTNTAYVTYVADVDIGRVDPVTLTDPVLANILRSYSVNASLINGVGYSPSNGGYFTLDGVDDYISAQTDFLGTSGSLFADGGNRWSVSCWFQPTAFNSAEDFVIGKGGGAGSSATFAVWVNTAQELSTRLRGGTILTISSSMTTDWYEVMITWDGVTAKAYLNGSFVNNIVEGGVADQQELFCLGTTASGGGLKFSGNIANAKLYDRALTASEIQQNFNATRGRFGV